MESMNWIGIEQFSLSFLHIQHGAFMGSCDIGSGAGRAIEADWHVRRPGHFVCVFDESDGFVIHHGFFCSYGKLSFFSFFCSYGLSHLLYMSAESNLLFIIIFLFSV